MADLKVNYKDDVLNTTKNTQRKYQMINNADGTVSFVDVTEYSQVGDTFGAKDINDTNQKCNELNENLTELNDSLSNSYTEHIVGTWVDGKPLYSKWVDCGVITNTNQILKFAHNVNNVETCFVNNAFFNDGTYSFCFTQRTGGDANYSLYPCVGKTEVEIFAGAYLVGTSHFYVEIRYTKTTD